MFLKNAWKVGLSLALALLIGGGLVHSSAEAGGKNQAKKKVTKVGEAQIIHELMMTKKLIAMARHDYAGYRSKAMHEVIHAIHLLEHHKHHPNPASVAGNLAGGTLGTKEQQQLSDAQMTQAIQNLHTISNQLQQLPGNHKHHHQANKAVHHAINHLKTALKIA